MDMSSHRFGMFLFAVFFILLCAGSLYGDPQKDDEIVVAQARDWKLTYADLQRIIGYYAPEQQALLAEDPKKVLTLVSRLTQAKILADKAYAEGLDKREDIREQLQILEEDKLAQAYVKDKLAQEREISEEDIKLYYQANKKRFSMPEQIHVRHLLLRLPRDAGDEEVERVRRRATELLAKIEAGKDFGELAAASSEDPGSRSNGGDLGWVTRAKLDPAFAKAAFAKAESSNVVGPVRSAYGWHLLRVEGHKKEQLLPLKAVRAKIHKEIADKIRATKTEEYINTALKQAGAVIHKDVLLDILLREP
jgi:parvulin-like peptidyl-prolyl isomerase